MLTLTAPEGARSGRRRQSALRKWIGLVVLCGIPLALAPPVFAEHEGEYCQETSGQCWPQGSSMAVGHEYLLQAAAADQRLARKHAELLALIEQIERPTLGQLGQVLGALKTQQQAWLSYRAAECELIGSLTLSAASWPTKYAHQCALNHSELRLRRVRDATRCVRRVTRFDAPSGPGSAPPDDYAIANCLQQLAPLTNHL